jgi:hypothetical protein
MKENRKQFNKINMMILWFYPAGETLELCKYLNKSANLGKVLLSMLNLFQLPSKIFSRCFGDKSALGSK